MFITTTNNIEGVTIKAYKGIVFGETVNGINFLKDWCAAITNFTGGRSAEYEQELIDARNIAIGEMQERAAQLGANAIIGAKVDVEPIGQNGGMMLIIASGTAVVI